MVVLTSSNGVLSSSGLILSNIAASAPVLSLPDYELDAYKPGTNTDNLVLSLGSSGQFDDVRILHPSTVEFDGNIYLFYAGYDGAKYQIGVATEAVSGFTGTGFTKYGSNPILTYGTVGQWDADSVAEPFVIYDATAGLWKMWYSSVGDEWEIGYATAPAATGPWTKYAGNPILSHEETWEGSAVGLQSILRENATTYKMLYTGWGDGKIGLATSSDGISWTKYASNPVLSPSGSGWMEKWVITPRTFIKRGSRYYIYFVGKVLDTPDISRIGYAYSDDLITWTVPATNPLLTATRTWEIGSTPPGEAEHPSYIQVGINQYIFYDCWYGSPPSIGVVVIEN